MEVFFRCERVHAKGWFGHREKDAYPLGREGG